MLTMNRPGSNFHIIHNVKIIPEHPVPDGTFLQSQKKQQNNVAEASDNHNKAVQNEVSMFL